MLKAESQAKHRVTADGVADYRPEVEKQARQLAGHRRQSNANGRLLAAVTPDTSPAEKVGPSCFELDWRSLQASELLQSCADAENASQVLNYACNNLIPW